MSSDDVYSRRAFLQITAAAAVLPWSAGASTGEPPNVILMMADDLGWGDAGYQGHPHLKTPCLDQMASNGLVFDRFYSASPVCSPTRGSCLTGRHPFRYGILGANSGDYDEPSRFGLPREEITLAEALKDAGYATGHFGKWHLGDLSGENACAPGHHGFDTWFSTVRKVPTLDPFGYFDENGPVRETFRGDDSRVIVDRALPFIQTQAEAQRPFLAVIWFHTPHHPVFSDPQYRSLYPDASEGEQHYWGAVSAMDAQIGRLRASLGAWGALENTMLWFCSDNGPAANYPGVSGGLRGGKGTLWEGGVRVPGLLEWPAVVKSPARVDLPVSTSDYFPTMLEAVGAPAPDRVLDGISLMPVLRGISRGSREEIQPRPPLYFEHANSVAMINGNQKLVAEVDGDALKLPRLYPSMREVDAEAQTSGPEVDRWLEQLRQWRASVKRSREGADYA